MTEKNQNKEPKSVEEALKQNRVEQSVPEQTQDEIVQQAMIDASAETRLTSLSDLSPEEIRVAKSTPIPVSNDVPQSTNQTSSLGFVGAKKEVQTETASEITSVDIAKAQEGMAKMGFVQASEEKELKALKDFVVGDGFNETTVGYMINTICSQPRGLPYVHTWDIPKELNIVKAVYTTVTTDGYIDVVWPTLKMVLGTSIGNSFWAASIATSLALYHVIQALPILIYTDENPRG